MTFLMTRKIDLIKAMRTFLAVVDNMSFSTAARQLNIVVSAVSRQVAELEQHYDCTLLYRTTRAMQLTSEGRFYQQEFQEILERLDALESTTRQRRQAIAGHLRITSPDNIDELGIQYCIASFLRKHPDVKLSWLMVNRYVNLIEEGFDLALRVGQLPDSSFIARDYQTIGVRFVASPEYLEQHGAPYHPKQLANHSMLIDESNRQPGRIRYFENGNEHQVTVHGQIVVNQGPVLAQLAIAGLGIAQLPGFMVEKPIEEGKLVPLLEAFNPPKADVSLVYPASKLTNPAVRAFIDHLLVTRKSL